MLIQFDLPQNLNGAVLMAELAAVGIIVNDQTSPMIDGAGNFWLDIDPTKESAAKPIVAAHSGTLD
jgi:hypothetical protein